MNTTDQTPKDGDFVAYLAELERRQMREQVGASTALQGPASPKTGAGAGKAFSAAAGTGSSGAGGVRPVTVSPEAAMAIVRSVPIGLVIVGIVLLVAGLMVDGGGLLMLIGIVMLAQAVRAMLKAAKEGTATRSQQVAALFSAHQQKAQK